MSKWWWKPLLSSMKSRGGGGSQFFFESQIHLLSGVNLYVWIFVTCWLSKNVMMTNGNLFWKIHIRWLEIEPCSIIVSYQWGFVWRICNFASTSDGSGALLKWVEFNSTKVILHFPYFFATFDDFSKFRSTFGVLYFKISSNMAKNFDGKWRKPLFNLHSIHYSLALPKTEI